MLKFWIQKNNVYLKKTKKQNKQTNKQTNKKIYIYIFFVLAF